MKGIASVLIEAFTALFPDRTLPTQEWEFAFAITSRFDGRKLNDRLVEDCLRAILVETVYPDPEVEWVVVERAEKLAEEVWHPLPSDVLGAIRSHKLALM